MNTTSESLLLRLREAQDAQAWSRFVQLYTPLIFYWARKNGCGRDDAADLVQDVMTIVLRQLPTWNYDSTRSFRGWLRTVTLNRHREMARKRQNAPIQLDTQAMTDAVDPAESWDREYASRLLWSAIELQEPNFAPKTWNALVESLRTQRPLSEIATESGVSQWTLYAARQRLVQRIQAELNGMLDDES